MTPTTRHETDAEHEAVRQVNRLAFGRDDEAGIVDALRAGGYARVSLVAEVDGRVVGHILFSDLPILTDGDTVPSLSLAPMAVRPEFQRRGIGSALVREGLEACRGQGHRIVVALGHPDFYPGSGSRRRWLSRSPRRSAGGVLVFTTGGTGAPSEEQDSCMGPPMSYAVLGIPRTLRVLAESGCTCRHLEYDQLPEQHVYLIAQRA